MLSLSAVDNKDGTFDAFGGMSSATGLRCDAQTTPPATVREFICKPTVFVTQGMTIEGEQGSSLCELEILGFEGELKYNSFQHFLLTSFKLKLTNELKRTSFYMEAPYKTLSSQNQSVRGIYYLSKQSSFAKPSKTKRVGFDKGRVKVKRLMF